MKKSLKKLKSKNHLCLFCEYRISAQPRAGAESEPMLASAQAPAAFDEEASRAAILVWSARTLKTHAHLVLGNFGRPGAVSLV